MRFSTICLALSPEAPSSEVMKTLPSSSMSIFSTPVSAMILLMILPPGPMTSLIFGGIDLDHDHARRELRELLARTGDRFGELVDDEVAGLARLFHRFAHDLDRDALHFDVHLNRRDALSWFPRL